MPGTRAMIRPLLRAARPAALLSLVALSACAGAAQRPAASSRPALVVLLAVDQMRADLLQRYAPYYTGGFRRLIDQGAYYTAVHDHATSETGPGHATLGTGVFPSHSGIVANDWFERSGDSWALVYTVQDTLSPIVGYPQEQGRSPLNLLRPGLADWILAADPRAKVVSVAGKDRAAILMAAKARGQVYWFNQTLGRFVTSSYYQSAYPAWVSRFNDAVVPTLLDSTWVEQSPVAARALAGVDTAAYEADALHTSFPHNFRDESSAFGGSFLRWVATTPFIDRAVIGLAKEAIDNGGLGKDDATDFVAIGVSQTDYVGHRYGPTSREQLDNMIRLDRELGSFFDYLDRTVGKGRWVLGLSADHGSTTTPEWETAHGGTGRRVTPAEMAEINRVAAAAASSAPAGQASSAVAQALRGLPAVADVYTYAEIASTAAPRDTFLTLYRHSYLPGRYGTPLERDYQVELRQREEVYMGAATGTGHGGPYFHDRWVPLVFLGGSITPSHQSTVARTVDMAPTLARLAGITPPADLDGKALSPPVK
jgi:hypothetical protein